MKIICCYLLLCSFALFSVRSRANELRDPTRPPAAPVLAAVVREPPPVLSAIMGVPSARVAIFNGQLVRGGSRVGAYLIEAVLEDGVRYRHGGATQELHFPHGASPVRSPSAAAAPSGAPSP